MYQAARAGEYPNDVPPRCSRGRRVGSRLAVDEATAKESSLLIHNLYGSGGQIQLREIWLIRALWNARELLRVTADLRENYP